MAAATGPTLPNLYLQNIASHGPMVGAMTGATADINLLARFNVTCIRGGTGANR